MSWTRGWFAVIDEFFSTFLGIFVLLGLVIMMTIPSLPFVAVIHYQIEQEIKYGNIGWKKKSILYVSALIAAVFFMSILVMLLDRVFS